jgi:hypothetical protein
VIQTLTYRARLDGRPGPTVQTDLQKLLDRMLAGRVELLGASIAVEGTTVALRMRIQGLDRWKISAIGRRFATFLFASERLFFRAPIAPELVVTELTRNKMREGEGRTPMVRPRRSVTKE